MGAEKYWVYLADKLRRSIPQPNLSLLCRISDRGAERMFYRYLIRVYLKSKNYNVAVCWYLWEKAIALAAPSQNSCTIE
ncbi:MAG: hypothetical protein F6K08_23380 [Okeania sp. SIO1H6]|nr:hypothetical protein [Okeania sp. SIO1H6]